MKLTIENFKGEIPRIIPRHLPVGFAQHARNVRLEDGAFNTYRGSALIHNFPGSGIKSIYKLGNTWLGWTVDVDVAPGPVAGDRIYYTGDGVPKVRTGVTIYDLALAAPAAVPTLVLGGVLDPDLTEDIVYVFTWVTGLDEESAPSPLSLPLAWSPGCTVTVSGFGATPAGRGIDRRRIYRSQTSAAGVTELFFVKEIVLATVSFVHDLAVDPLQEVIPSKDFDTPPAGLAGLTPLSNGMMAAFTGRELCFCEPYIPHAWPIKYRLKTDYEIVGLVAFGTTLAILTKGTPYIAQGSAPENMVMERMESGLPCVSARGIVDLGYAGAYPSHEGLVLITASSSQVVTRPLFAKLDWAKLSPETFFAENFGGKYIFSYVESAVNTLNGGVPTTNYAGLDNYDTGGPVANPLALVFFGGGADTETDVRAMGLIDLTNSEQPFFVRIAGGVSDDPTGLYFNAPENILYMIDATQVVKQFDSPMEASLTGVWKSGRIELTSLETFGAILIQAEGFQGVGNELSVRIYADGDLIHTEVKLNQATRLPAEKLARRWEIEIEGVASVTSVQIAGTIDELTQ